MSQACWDFCILYWLPSSAQLCMLRHEALDKWGKQQKTRWVKSTHAEWTEELSHNIQASSKSHDYCHCSVCLWYHQIPWNLLPLVKPAGKPQSNVKICRCLHFFLIVKKNLSIMPNFCRSYPGVQRSELWITGLGLHTTTSIFFHVCNQVQHNESLWVETVPKCATLSIFMWTIVSHPLLWQPCCGRTTHHAT